MRDFRGSVAVVCGGGKTAATAGSPRGISSRAGARCGSSSSADDDPSSASPGVVVDALFGTGFSGAPRAEAAALIEAINALDAPVVAVDVPSGVDASTGEVAGAAVEAALTVTFHGEKVGLRVAPGSFHAGRVEVADIGLEPRETAHALVGAKILRRIPRRGATGRRRSTRPAPSSSSAARRG